MKDLPVVVFAGYNSVIKNRILLLLSEQEIEFYEAKSSYELQRILAGKNYRVDLLISDLEIDSHNEFSTVSLIKQMKMNGGSHIPIIVLSAESKKNIVEICLQTGATEYVLKPFKDEYLKDKVLKYINFENLNRSTLLNFNLNDFLSGEIYKAKKGDYSFTLLSMKFFADIDEDMDYAIFLRHSDLIYQSIRELFWEADLYIQYGFQSHFGFFPFCTSSTRNVVSKKIHACFENLKKAEPALSYCSYTQSFASYPLDGNTVAELLTKLKEK
jgi:CheY-like chemotaxis protein